MTARPPSALRLAVGALVIFVLTLAGVGRGTALAASGEGLPPVIAGLAAPICHAGAPGLPDSTSRHVCCDQCALGTAAILPCPPHAAGHVAEARTIERRPAGRSPVAVARLRTPRLAQGPPQA